MCSQIADTRVMKQAFGRKIASRRIMLMQRVNGHSLASRSGCLGDPLAKDIITFIADSNPINRAQDDRITAAKNHNAATTKPKLLNTFDAVVGHHESDFRRRIDVEGGQAKSGIRLRVGLGLRGEPRNRSDQHENQSQDRELTNSLLHRFAHRVPVLSGVQAGRPAVSSSRFGSGGIPFDLGLPPARWDRFPEASWRLRSLRRCRCSGPHHL